jgi:Fe-S-cluster containining protein
MLAVKEGLLSLPKQIRESIYGRAKRTVMRSLSLGYDIEKLASINPSDVITKIGLSPESVCPFLIGGVCAIYDSRPLICVIWGHPMHDGVEISCCKQTFVGDVNATDAVDYKSLRRKVYAIGRELGCGERSVPLAYAVLLLRDEIDPGGNF